MSVLDADVDDDALSDVDDSPDMLRQKDCCSFFTVPVLVVVVRCCRNTLLSFHTSSPETKIPVLFTGKCMLLLLPLVLPLVLLLVLLVRLLALLLQLLPLPPLLWLMLFATW